MKRLLIAAALILTSAQSFAADSSWLLCDNGSLVLNTLEHRSAGGNSRETNVKLLFGEHLVEGQLDDVDAGAISMTSTRNTNDSFAGDISIDYSTSILKIKGDLTLDGFAVPVDSKMTCKEMNGRL